MKKSRPLQLNDIKWLANRYATNSPGEIASELGCSRNAVVNAIRRLGIVERTASEASKRREQSKFTELNSKDWLERAYETKSTIMIAQELGCNPQTVANALTRHGLNTHEKNERWASIRKFCPTCNKPFEATGAAQIYCSPECNLMELVCQMYDCGKTFYKAAYDHNRWESKFCSIRCLDAFRRLPRGNRISEPTRKINHEGYVDLYMGQVNGKSVWVKEHRYVMEQKLGRRLVAGENVHHINGVRTDNRLENLELWSTWQPSGQHVADKIKWARELLEFYKDFPED